MQSPNAQLIGTLTTQAAGKEITWSVYAGVVERGQNPLTDAMPIVRSWCGQDPLPEDLVGFVVKTRQFVGSDQLTVCEPTIVEKGKNIGKKNQTNALTQAIKDAESEFRKRSDKKDNTYIHPMLATDIEVTELASLEYPLDVQEKLDGLRVIAKDGVLWSRGGKKFPIPEHLQRDVAALGATGLVWDGEFYGCDANGEPYPLQRLQGATRGTASSKDSPAEREARDSLYICIFDVVLPNNYSERARVLKERLPVLEHCRVIETVTVNSALEVRKLFQQKIAQGREGLILRLINDHSPYEESINSKRSRNLYKLKAEYSAEGIIREVIQGKKGRDLGAAIFVIRTLPETFPERFRHHAPVTFDVVPNLPLPVRRQIYNAPGEYVGQLYTFSFQDVSELGQPLRAKGIGLRDKDV